MCAFGAIVPNPPKGPSGQNYGHPPHELPPPAPWHTKLSGLVPMQESVCYMGSLLVRTYGKGQTFLTG
ncbi:MAG TPA: hypothetical protein VKH15_17005, partial [Candidatus Acidoferrum sp.]|nr:hypothetical protein [Candidatus Acidoferrum sp.]